MRIVIIMMIMQSFAYMTAQHVNLFLTHILSFSLIIKCK